MPITISPSENIETVVNIPICLEASAIHIIPQEDERCIDLTPTGPNWTFSSTNCMWKKISGSSSVPYVLDAPASVASTIYSRQPFYIYAGNFTFTTPPAPNRFYASFVGTRDDLGRFYGWYIYKNCGNQSPSACNATTSGDSSQNWKSFIIVADTIVTPTPQGVNAFEYFRVRSDGINLYWDYNHATRWDFGVYVIPLPESTFFDFYLNSAMVNNEWWSIKTFRGTFQGEVPLTWTAPIGGTISGTGNTRCFTASTPGAYQVCVDTEFDEPVCVNIDVNTLYIEPIGFDCDECAFTSDVVSFRSNGGINGVLTAVDEFGQPSGTVIDSLTWRAPNTPANVTLTYTLADSTATCDIHIIERLELLNVEGNIISGLVPGETLQLYTNYPENSVRWENLTCQNIVSPLGLITIPKVPGDSCFGALDCTIRARIVDVPDQVCNNIITSSEEGVAFLDFRIIVDPVFPTPDLGGPVPTKWKPEVPDYRVIVNQIEGGCDETYIRNKVAIQRWTVNYTGLAYDYTSPCDPIPCCDDPIGTVGGYTPELQVAKRLDDFWNYVLGESGYFTVIDLKTGVVWKKVRFETKMERDHINWRRIHSRSITFIWNPCCVGAPAGGVCPHNTVVLDSQPPNTVLGLTYLVVDYSELTIFWDKAIDNIGVKGYEIEVDGGKAIDVGRARFYNHTGLQPFSEHTYRVRAYDFAGNYSDWSAPLVATTPFADIINPTIPTNFFASAPSTSEIDLLWDASSDNIAVTGYQLLIDGVVLDVGLVTAHAHTGLDPGSCHSYHIRAYDAAGNKSPWSGELRNCTRASVMDSGSFVVEGGDPVIEA
jgi:hypothetical protein